MTEHGITDRNQVQWELDHAKYQWERTFDAIPDLIAIIDTQHRILRVNRAMAQRLGRTPEQCIGLMCYGYVHGLDAPPSYCPHEQALADGREHMVEICEKRLGGYFLITCTPLFDEQGRVLGTVHVARDITQRKRMEEDLRRSESILAQAGEMTHLGAWEIEVVNPEDLNCNRLRWSDEVYRIFGYEPGSVPITNDLFFQHVHPDDRHRIVEAMTDALTRKEHYTIEHRIIRTDGVERIVFEHADIRFDFQGRPVQILGAVQDITERKQAEEALRTSEAELQRLNERLELEVAERTEELTQTIDRLYDEVMRRVLAENELRKHSQMLEERAAQLQKLTLELSQAEDRERKRLAEILHDDLQQLLAAAKFRLGILSSRLGSDGEAQKLGGMVKDLLQQAIDRSRSLSHELSPPALSYSDVREIFDGLAGQLQVKHDLTVQVRVFGRIEVRSEPLKAFLYKAAQEMLFNVVKHAEVKEARLRLKRRHGRIYLTVADSGRGFEPQKAGQAGFGLLSIRERIRLLGGRVRVRSAPGKGCIFLLVVPDTETPKVEDGEHRTEDRIQQTAPSPVFRQPSSRLRLLLVDDHKIVRQGIEAMLAQEPDVEIVGQAGNGREAVGLALELRPDVIVMDVSMPVMAGDEATRRIKQHLPRTRVIALSMFDDARVADRMRRAGAAAYLLKTAPAQELLAAIRGREAVTQES